jgi:hypothetical protein
MGRLEPAVVRPARRGRAARRLIVDDSNVVYEGWGTRENRIASLICERPVYMVRLDEADVIPTSQLYDVTPVGMVRIAGGGPTAAYDRHVYRVQPVDPSTCSGLRTPSQAARPDVGPIPETGPPW